MNIKRPLIKKPRKTKGQKIVESLEQSGELKRNKEYLWLDVITVLFVAILVVAVINGIVKFMI